MAAFNDLEKHFQQLNADLINNARESESDMFDQRNQSFQTIILSSSVMFSSLATVIIQGFLPSNANYALYISYALTCALSFMFLFLSIVLCIEVVLRASRFMYYRAQAHSDQLKKSIGATREMLSGIRTATDFNLNGSIKEGNYSQKVSSVRGGGGGVTSSSGKGPRTFIAELSKVELDVVWSAHQEKIQNLERISTKAPM